MNFDCTRKKPVFKLFPQAFVCCLVGCVCVCVCVCNIHGNSQFLREQKHRLRFDPTSILFDLVQTDTRCTRQCVRSVVFCLLYFPSFTTCPSGSSTFRSKSRGPFPRFPSNLPFLNRVALICVCVYFLQKFTFPMLNSNLAGNSLSIVKLSAFNKTGANFAKTVSFLFFKYVSVVYGVYTLYAYILLSANTCRIRLIGKNQFIELFIQLHIFGTHTHLFERKVDPTFLRKIKSNEIGTKKSERNKKGKNLVNPSAKRVWLLWWSASRHSIRFLSFTSDNSINLIEKLIVHKLTITTNEQLFSSSSSSSLLSPSFFTTIINTITNTISFSSSFFLEIIRAFDHFQDNGTERERERKGRCRCRPSRTGLKRVKLWEIGSPPPLPPSSSSLFWSSPPPPPPPPPLNPPSHSTLPPSTIEAAVRPQNFASGFSCVRGFCSNSLVDRATAASSSADFKSCACMCVCHRFLIFSLHIFSSTSSSSSSLDIFSPLSLSISQIFRSSHFNRKLFFFLFSRCLRPPKSIDT